MPPAEVQCQGLKACGFADKRQPYGPYSCDDKRTQTGARLQFTIQVIWPFAERGTTQLQDFDL